MKCVLLIAVFCVVPCAFQNVWDDYETWYDDFNNLDDDAILSKVDTPVENLPETIPINKDDKVAENDDYNYGDYEIEDNRDEIKSKLDQDQEVNLEENDESAIKDFDAIQQILNKNVNEEDGFDDNLGADEYPVDLNELLPENVNDNENVQKNDDIGNEGIQQEKDDINKETQQILDTIDSAFDEDKVVDNDDSQIKNEANIELLPEEVQQILDVIDASYDEDKIDDDTQIKNESNIDVIQDIDDINKKTQQILENIDPTFDVDKVDDDADVDLQVKNEANDDVQQEKDDKETQQIVEDLDTNIDENKIDDDDDNDNLQIENEASKEVLPEDIQADIQDIIEETRQILQQTNKEFDENEDKQEDIVDKPDQSEILIENNENNENLNADEENIGEVLPHKDDINTEIKDIQQVLVDTNGSNDETFAVEDKLNDKRGNNSDEDNVDKVYEDLNADLDKLFETWKKLSDDDEKLDVMVESIEKSDNDKKQVMQEANADDDYGRDQDNIGDEVKDENNFDYEGEAEILALRKDYYDSILDKDLSKLFKEFEDAEGDSDDEMNDDIAVDEQFAKLYGNDALVADSDNSKQLDTDDNSELKDKEKNMEEPKADLKSEYIDDLKEESTIINEYQDDPTTTETLEQFNEDNTKPTKEIENLSSGELEELTNQFVILNDSEMKKDADDTPIYITLNADEPVVITSPNYPNAYPTDISTIDWILEGFGTGIEVNVTDLGINSAMGHYLMLKPGQTDASGDQGIVFAYRINHERRYRFRDVNRMLVRFHPVGGMSFSRGFQLSARIIEAPIDDETDQDLPDPEYLLPEPVETATLFLAGYNSTSFEDIREEFRRLLADMATMYINVNDIDPGLNATTVVTQITRTYVCNVNWPGFDSCVSVTFGVPLNNDDDVTRLTEEELLDMWKSYSGRDPFAARLAYLGISEYIPPKDSYILTMWVVIGSAVLISATMLAFVLWRYSCVENYTRMMVEEGDTDGIYDKKRGLDMYPTPHQTLPPLYTENDYKWADGTFDDSARVDMGGFANNTFTRDELSDESEDEVKKDKNAYQPRDFNAA